MSYDQLGWWIGHELELDGILVVGIPVALDLARARSRARSPATSRGAELVTAEDAFLGSHVRALMVTLAEKDAYTERHTRRVALRAVQVGEGLGLSRGHLRALAIGGLRARHRQARRPRRDPEEARPARRRRVRGDQAPPRVGHAAARRARRLPDAVRRLVRDHHERLDGRGYPSGLDAATQLDLDTRILTVCDVYDALISPRVYRPAWTHEQAMQLLRDREARASTRAASKRSRGCSSASSVCRLSPDAASQRATQCALSTTRGGK